jgi:hypothetical protein
MQGDIFCLLNKCINALIEMRTSKAVKDDPEMQELDKKAGELLDSLPPLEPDNDDEQKEI